MKSPQQVLIAGYYGFGNAGDEAILAAMLGDLRALKPDLDPVVVSGDPTSTASIHRVRSVLWTDTAGILREAEACRLMLLGGGGIFHDYWGFDPDAVLTSYHSGIGFYSSFPVLATLLKKPLMLYAVGVGPLESELGKGHTLTAFQQARLATVRDAESKHLLERLGINSQQIRVTADPAFSLPPAPPERVQSNLLETGLPKGRRPLLGVAVRNWNVGVLPNWERQVAGALDQFIERHAACALFVPLQNLQGELVDDFAVGERVRQQMRHADRTVNFRGSTLAQEKAGLLAACDVVVGMRLHSLIFALRSRVPAVALIYDPKVRHLMAQMDCEGYGLELPSMNAQALSELLERAYHERGRLQVHLSGRVESLVDLAQENARLAISLLEADSQASSPISEATADLLRQVCLSQLRREAIAQREVQHMARSKFWRLGLAYWSWRKKLVGATWPLRHLLQWLQRNNA